ncbi:MAG: rubrerythrin family protein [Candidatus Rifleibacteriota bacterium]
MSTKENLAAAFAGESQANRKYLAFASKAEQEGYQMIARLFRANAEAETLHAHSHLRAMNGIHDTLKNLESAIQGEGYEFREMYPKFIEEAEKEGEKVALASFKNAMAAEEVHHGLYSQALEALKSGKDLEDKQIHICSVCGNTFIGDLPEKCHICNAPKAKFIEIK